MSVEVAGPVYQEGSAESWLDVSIGAKRNDLLSGWIFCTVLIAILACCLGALLGIEITLAFLAVAECIVVAGGTILWRVSSRHWRRVRLLPDGLLVKDSAGTREVRDTQIQKAYIHRQPCPHIGLLAIVGQVLISFVIPHTWLFRRWGPCVPAHSTPLPMKVFC